MRLVRRCRCCCGRCCCCYRYYWLISVHQSIVGAVNIWTVLNCDDCALHLLRRTSNQLVCFTMNSKKIEQQKKKRLDYSGRRRIMEKIENVRCDGGNFPTRTLFKWNVFDVCKAFNLIWYLANSVWHKPGIFARKAASEKKRESSTASHQAIWARSVLVSAFSMRPCELAPIVHTIFKRNTAVQSTKANTMNIVRWTETKPSVLAYASAPKNNNQMFFSVVLLQSKSKMKYKRHRKRFRNAAVVVVFIVAFLLYSFVSSSTMTLHVFGLVVFTAAFLLLHVRLPSLRFICVHILNH